jgi:NhaP-type Na+/H+ and K+/H+ antiporter
VLGIAAARWYRRAPRAGRAWPVLSRATRAVVFAGLVVGLVAGALLGLTDPVSRVSGYDWVRCLLLGAVRGGALAATAYVLAWTVASRTQTVGSRTQTVGSRTDPPGT